MTTAPIPGAPRQPGDVVQIVAVADSTGSREHLGKIGRVAWLDYEGAGQRYPGDPLIGVELGSVVVGFWREEVGEVVS